ncbi:HD-domain/PDEase-like protein [Linderina pennispora]|uniref:HD-domain/PDEase-like protein n=1 Tax=Linderina pennispora TaxID=61395 RepID=A0A1Y1WKA4_9FUNG|nr:HD-domain/PDEase-like protein [Linderina pennispora]ORX73912.1 HD-domain/PDEase-like protein [Linderina pennispora]
MLCSKQNLLSEDELATVEEVMTTYFDEQWAQVGMDFDPWKYSHAEKLGILLGVFSKMHVLRVLELTPSEMLDFCLDIEALYNDVPYHSFNHAIDVVVKLYFVLNDLQASSYLASYDVAVLLISGLCHDAGHPGLNNLFQRNANTKYAQKYPDAILERFSIDLAVEYVEKHKLLRNVENVRDPVYNDNTATERDIASRMMHGMRTAILYTDMSRHFEEVEECKLLISVLSKKARRISGHDLPQEECPNGYCERPDHSPRISGTPDSKLPPVSGAASERTRAPTPMLPLLSTMQNTAISIASRTESRRRIEDLELTTLPTPPTTAGKSKEPGQDLAGDEPPLLTTSKPHIKVRRSISMCDALLDSTQRQSLVNILLHAVDIFNPVLPWTMCKKWSDLMNIESFNQGDLEKNMGLPVSPNMDRDTTDQRQVSLDFGNIIIRPFFIELVSLFPVDDKLLLSLDKNLKAWSRLTPDNKHKVSPPVGANSDMYSWPSESRSKAISRTHSRVLNEGRRLSIAAGTVEIPQSRLEMIRRHSHEGFEALHRRMVGRLFSKHLERIQERRNVSYQRSLLDGSGSSLAAKHRIQPLSTSFSPRVHGNRVWNEFSADMLSPVTEGGTGDEASNLGNDAETVLSTLPQGPTTLTPLPIEAEELHSIYWGENTQPQDSISAYLGEQQMGSNPRPKADSEQLPDSVEPASISVLPPFLNAYQISSGLSFGRQYRSSSLDPTLLASLPSTYPSLAHPTHHCEQIPSGSSDEQ